jgi:hypothetical protein
MNNSSDAKSLLLCRISSSRTEGNYFTVQTLFSQQMRGTHLKSKVRL